MNEAIKTIEAIAKTHDVTIEQLAADIYELAAFIQGTGNKGILIHDIASRNNTAGTDLKTYFLDEVSCREALDGIMFYAKPSRRSDFSGWYVKKRPVIGTVWEWQRRWVELYQQDTDAARAITAAIEAAEQQEAEAVKRSVETFAQGSFQQFTTLQIGHRLAIAEILHQRATRRYFDLDRPDPRMEITDTSKKRPRKKEDFRQSPQRYFQNVWRREFNLMYSELEYRKETGDELAAEIIKKSASYFFTEEFQAAAAISEIEPDFMIDVDYLPTPAPDKLLIRYKTDYQLTNEFMQLIAADEAGHSDKTTFEYEDRQLILKALKKMYARSKGQKPDDEPTSITEEKDS